MRVIRYSEENLTKIGVAQGKPYSEVREIFKKMQLIDPDETYYAMADFVPLPTNPDRMITYISRAALLFAFKDATPMADLDMRDLDDWTDIKRKTKAEMMGID